MEIRDYQGRFVSSAGRARDKSGRFVAANDGVALTSMSHPTRDKLARGNISEDALEQWGVNGWEPVRKGWLSRIKSWLLGPI